MSETPAVNSVQSSKPSVAADRKLRIQMLVRTAGMLPMLILLGLMFAALSDRFLSVQNLSIVAQQASINTVLAAGMTFVILTGGIDLSVGAILASSAMVAVAGSFFSEKYSDTPFAVSEISWDE